MLISGKGKCFPLFGCLGNRFLENQFRCLVGPNILRKSFYGKSIPVFDLSKHFTENTLRKWLDRCAFGWAGSGVRGSELWVRGSEVWVCGSEVSVNDLRIGALVLSVCAFVLCFSSLFLSVLLCVESDPEMNWSENESVNSFLGQRGKFWSTGMQFPENCIFHCNQTCGKGWKWFPEIIFIQNKRILKFTNFLTICTKFPDLP